MATSDAADLKRATADELLVALYAFEVHNDIPREYADALDAVSGLAISIAERERAAPLAARAERDDG